MTLPPDRITLTGLRATGRHGVFEHERREGQEFVVDVVLDVDTRAAASSDDLARTVDYGTLAQDVHDVVTGDPVDLIETLAQRIADVCLRRDGVLVADVTVHKPQAPVPVAFDDVAVRIVRPSPGRVVRRAALSLGANLGDRLAALQAAVDVVVADPRVVGAAVSGVVETDPVGGPEQDDYLNAVLVVDTTCGPADLLALGHRAEARLGRTRGVRWGPRTLDVDLLAVGGAVSSEPDLTLPHPRAHERAFVLVPWAQVDPDAVVPGHGRVADLAARVGATGVRPRPDLALRVAGPGLPPTAPETTGEQP